MKPDKLLTLFNLRPIEAELFSQLFVLGPMTANETAKQVNVSRTSVYSLLKSLIGVGLISEALEGGVKVFVASAPEKIQILIEEKQREVLAAGRELESLKRVYQEQEKSLMPKLQLYTDRKELQQMMKDLLLYQDITALAYWPIKKMLELLGSEFLKDFHQKRIERNISLQTIWPKNQIPDLERYSFLLADQDSKREIRIAPASVDFSLGYLIYNNTVRFISSSKEKFGFLVESSELAETMKGQFMIIWRQSKIIPSSMQIRKHK